MRKGILMMALLIILVSSSFAVTLVENDNGKFAMTFSGIPSYYYDMEAEADDGEAVMGFTINTFWLAFVGSYNDFTYVVIPAYETGTVAVLEASIKYKINDMFALKMGYFKAPFGRFYNSSGMKLLMFGRNPLVGPFSPRCQMGIAPEASFMDGKLLAQIGVFNGDGFQRGNDDENLDFTGALHIMPLGKMTIDESAHKGYDEPRIAIVPGFHLETEHFNTDDNLGSMTAGAHIAFRMKTLAVDALYYMGSDEFNPDMDPTKSNGLSASVAYAVNGKIEPSFRFTLLEPNDELDDDEVTTIEFGTNYYINSFGSRVGLYYINQTVAGLDDPLRNEIRVFYEGLF